MEPPVANSNNSTAIKEGEINILAPTSVQRVEEVNDLLGTQTENIKRVETVEVLNHGENQVDLNLQWRE